MRRYISCFLPRTKCQCTKHIPRYLHLSLHLYLPVFCIRRRQITSAFVYLQNLCVLIRHRFNGQTKEGTELMHNMPNHIIVNHYGIPVIIFHAMICLMNRKNTLDETKECRQWDFLNTNESYNIMRMCLARIFSLSGFFSPTEISEQNFPLRKIILHKFSGSQSFFCRLRMHSHCDNSAH